MDIGTLRLAIDSRDALTAKRDLAGLESQAGRTEQATEKMARNSGAALGDMSRFVGQVAAALAAVNLAKQYLQIADAVTVLNNQLKLAMGTAKGAEQAYKDLYAIAQQSRVSFTELGGTFAAIRRATQETGLSYGRLLVVTEAIGNAMTVSGGSAQSMNAALIQLQQGMASGTLRGEELNSVMEQTPRLAKAIADGLGVSIGQLRAMGQDGKLTSDAVIRALESQAAVLRGEVAGATLTVGQANTVLGNSIAFAIGKIDEATGASGLFAGALQTIAGAVDRLGNLAEMYGALERVNKAASDGANDLHALSVIYNGMATVFEAVAVLGLNVGYVIQQVSNEIVGIGKQAAAVARGDFAEVAEIRKQMIADGERARQQVDRQSKNILDARRLAAIASTGEGQDEPRFLRMMQAQETGVKKVTKALIDKTKAAEKLREKERELAEQRRRDLEFGEYMNRLVGERAEAEKKAAEALIKPYEDAAKSAQERALSLEIEIEAMHMANSLQISMAQAVELTKIARLKEAQIANMSNDEIVQSIQKEIEARKKIIALMSKKEMMSVKPDDGMDQAKKDLDAFGALIGQINQAKIQNVFGPATEGAVKFASALEAVFQIQEATQKAISANAVKNADDQAKMAQERIKIEEQSASATLSAYSTMTGALRGYAKEGSKTYGALLRAERVFRAFELASALATAAKKIGLFGAVTTAKVAGDATMAASSTAAAGVDVAASMTQGMASAAAGVAAQAKGDPYTAFPRMAAMAAAMAALGFAVFGGGGGKGFAPTNSGTGTVLGDKDAQSESLKNSLEILNSTQDAALIYSQQMASSLRAIEGQIGGLTNVFLRTGGGGVNALRGGIATGAFDTGLSRTLKGLNPFPGIGDKLIGALFGKKTSIVGSGIAAGAQTLGNVLTGGFQGQTYADIETKRKVLGVATSKKRSTQYGDLDNTIEGQITSIFAGVGDAVTSASKLLGLDMTKTEKALQDYVINLGRIDLQGLSGAQIAEKLSAVFGAEADKIAASVIPGFEKLQQVGEGYFETLTRVASQFENVQMWMRRFGDQLGSVGIQGAIAADELIKAFGGLEQYTSIASQYYQDFYSEQERNAMQTKELTDALAAMGFEMPGSIAAFRALVDAQDLSTEEGRAAYAALLKLSGAFAEVTNAANDAWKELGEGFMKEVDRIRGIVAKESSTNYEYLQARFAILTAQARSGDQTAAGQLVGVSAAINEAASLQARTALELAVMRSNLANSLEETTAIVTGQPVRVDAPIATANAAEDTKAMRAQIETLNKRIDELTTNSKAENQAQFSALQKLVTILDNATQGGSLAVRTINGETVKTS